MKKILLTGSNGQLGQCFRSLALHHPEYTWHFMTRDKLNLEDTESISSCIRTISPDIIINCAAYTQVDQAETDKEKALRINGQAVGEIAIEASRLEALLIHISTDYVYGGKKNTPFIESDPCEELNVYGQTKRIGEQKALSLNSNTLVLRTSWLYAQHGQNFIKSMLRFAREKDQLNVVYDQVGSPTYAPDLAECVLKFIKIYDSSDSSIAGIYNYSNEGVCSWYDFAREAIRAKGIHTPIHPVRTEAFPRPAQRPSYSLMDKSKIKAVLGITIPHWKDSLMKMLADLEI